MSARRRLYRTEAVVLRRMDLGEADRILTFFTPDRGKLRAVANGVRRPGSRKAGHLEPFMRTRLLLAKGRQLDVVTQAESVESFPAVTADLERLGAAAYLVELIDRFGVEELGSDAMYDLLLAALRQLNSGEPLQPLTRYYEFRLLDQVGFRPELQRCVNCGKPLEPQDQYFSAGEGGVLCPTCGRRREGAQRLSLAALKVMRHFQRSHYQEAIAPSVRPRVHAEVETLMESYLTFLLERRLHAPEFVRRVRELPPAAAK